MKQAITGVLSTAVVFGLLSVGPAWAQQPGNPGENVSPTPYSMRWDYAPFTGPGYPGYGYNWPANGQPWFGAGLFAPIGALAAGLGAVGSAVVGAPYYGAPYYAQVPPTMVAPPAAAQGYGCRAWQNQNGEYMTACGPG